MRLYRAGFGVVLAMVMTAGLAGAQDPTFLPGTDPMDFAAATTNWTNTLIGNQMIQRSVEHRYEQRGGKVVRNTTKAKRGARTVPAGAASLSYRPDASIRAQAKKSFVARISKMNPAVGPQLSKAMETFDMFAEYPKMVAEEGYRRDNVADAFASTVVAAWMGSKGKLFELDNGGQRIFRSRIATSLAADPRFKSAAFRQRLGDEMQLTTVFLLSGLGGAIQQGKTGPYSAAMASLFKGLTGMDANRVKLTSQGFVSA